ncbi:hypothetical protein GGTG_07997 [Gaeumannomyces tritici R3-111a-1]|uniref:Uncharacterized protein n=1 Tax=Gaeumannomyces tritici (strain R3-111a-1) TaxID=644352 RepID=J3P3A9_GAET3|nr:hypothetical protein GGTG_07997 [Gaeumannomyces tritici R3-111a-1]EJT74151.1 hypothetical protein GGTG_07997 [Gaeumannomyces tritici R3-111a-1]
MGRLGFRARRWVDAGPALSSFWLADRRSLLQHRRTHRWMSWVLVLGTAFRCSFRPKRRYRAVEAVDSPVKISDDSTKSPH